MGYGDEIIATGLAKGAYARGKRVAFGDGTTIRSWKGWAREVFKNNPNIAPPGSEDADDLEWVAHYKGNRMTGKIDSRQNKIIFNPRFQAPVGEFFFDDEEQARAQQYKDGPFIVIEPNVRNPQHANKDWGFAKYQTVALYFRSAGYRIVQFKSGIGSQYELDGAQLLEKPFRDAVAILQHAKLYIGCEGAQHHAAAAVGVKAVVLFGGLVPVSLTG